MPWSLVDTVCSRVQTRQHNSMGTCPWTGLEQSQSPLRTHFHGLRTLRCPCVPAASQEGTQMSSLCPHWLGVSFLQLLPLRAAAPTSSDGQESIHLRRLPITSPDLGFKFGNNKGRVLLKFVFPVVSPPNKR